MKNSLEPELERKLDKVIVLLQQLVAIELYSAGASKESIGKSLHIAKASVVSMLRGAKKESGDERKTTN